MKTSENPPSQRPSQRQISLSEALSPVAPIHLPLKTLSESLVQKLAFWRCFRKLSGPSQVQAQLML